MFEKKNTKKFQEEIISFKEDVQNSALINADDFQITNVSPMELFRTFIEYNFLNNIQKKLVLSHMEALSDYCPAGNFYFIHFLAHCLKYRLENISEEEAKEITQKPSIESIKDILSSFFENSSMLDQEAAINLFDHNGFATKFQVVPSNNSFSAVVFEKGYHIPGSLEITQNSELGFDSIELHDCNIILYDGVIESISEIDRILTVSNQEKTSICLICRKASKDVGYTCALNNKMGKTKVFLYVPEHEFWMNDVEKFSIDTQIFCHGYSSGTLISMVDFENLFSCKVTIKKEGLFIKSDSLKSNGEALTTFYLSDKHSSKSGIFQDQLNFYRALMQQISMFGVINNKDFLKKFGIDISSVCSMKTNYHPSYPVFRAYKEAFLVSDKILSIGYIIKKESKDD